MGTASIGCRWEPNNTNNRHQPPVVGLFKEVMYAEDLLQTPWKKLTAGFADAVLANGISPSVIAIFVLLLVFFLSKTSHKSKKDPLSLEGREGGMVRW
jgi:hypothetical protein